MGSQMKKKDDVYDLDLANSIIQGFAMYLMEVMKVKFADRAWTDVDTVFDSKEIESTIDIPLTTDSPFSGVEMNIKFKRR